MHNTEALYTQLNSALIQLNLQIYVLETAAKEKGVSVLELQNPDGSYVLPPLLSAKAQLLNGMAILRGRK